MSKFILFDDVDSENKKKVEKKFFNLLQHLVKNCDPNLKEMDKLLEKEFETYLQIIEFEQNMYDEEKKERLQADEKEIKKKIKLLQK